jgi:hypothetical protein
MNVPSGDSVSQGGAERIDGAASTGHPVVDAAVASLDRAAARSPREQVAAYVDAHRALQETLNTIEER